MFEEDRQHICCLGISDLSVIVKVIMVEEEEVYRKKEPNLKKGQIHAFSHVCDRKSYLTGWDQWH